jgi:hypothetical protein
MPHHFSGMGYPFFSLFPMTSHRCVLFLYVVLLKILQRVICYCLKIFCINSRFICFFCFFSYRSPTWTTLICHLTEATKSTKVYPAFAMSGMRTSTLWWLLTRISCHLGILLGGYRYVQHYLFTL